MRLKDPLFLLLLLLWIPMIWVYVRRERGMRPTIRFSDISPLEGLKPTWAVRARHMVFGLRLLGIGLLTIALARPQKGHTQQEVSTLGVDIMLVLDVSTSMKALDFRPKNRLFVAKETIKEFVSRRQNDRLGLVVFAGRSFTKCPLTLDYGILNQFLDDVDFGEIEDGTAIGVALATAANRIKDSEAKSRVMILLTDGANNRGEITPQLAAQAAAELGIRIYTIGVGKKGQVPYPVEYVDRRTGKVVETRVQMVDNIQIDDRTLTEVAEATGGRYFRAQNSKELQQIYGTIDKLEKTEIKTTSYTTWSEHFFAWLLAGFAVLLLEIVLANTRFRRVP